MWVSAVRGPAVGDDSEAALSGCGQGHACAPLKRFACHRRPCIPRGGRLQQAPAACTLKALQGFASRRPCLRFSLPLRSVRDAGQQLGARDVCDAHQEGRSSAAATRGCLALPPGLASGQRRRGLQGAVPSAAPFSTATPSSSPSTSSLRTPSSLYTAAQRGEKGKRRRAACESKASGWQPPGSVM